MTRLRFLFFAVLAAACLLPALPTRPAFAATYTVDTMLDVTATACTPAGGDCTLRGAITNANASGAADTIAFDALVFPDLPSPPSITLSSALPALTTGNETINATGLGVVVRGDEGRGFDCLPIQSSGNTITGVQFTDCMTGINLNTTTADGNTIGPGNTIFDSTTGIAIAGGATGNTVTGSKIGTNSAGMASADGGNDTGVAISGSNNMIGGTAVSNRNVISANIAVGVSIGGGAGNIVIGNFIGTNVNGTGALPNGTGVSIQFSAASNVIGGLLPGQSNLISGNTSANVELNASGTANTVQGNLIGPDINGAGTLSSGHGVLVRTASAGNTIGPRNVISDNTNGLLITGSGTSGNVVKGNLIGTNPAGTAALANSGDGVHIDPSATSNTIGGTVTGETNIIAFNTGDGVEVNGAGTTGNPVRGNSIHSNGGLEINNVSGGNLELTPPLIFSTVAATVTGTACSSCAVDIFSDTSTADARFYEGSATAAADGNFTFRNDAPFIEANVTATNTDAPGNTSELATSVTVDSDADGTVDGMDTDDDNDGIADASDPCRIFPEDYDGFQDADGCPDPDNDLDGICDTGQTSVSCAGSDSGQTAFYPPDHNHTNPTIDCRNVPEDFDGFKDTDGCPEPDNDNDAKPDANDTCPGNDNVMGLDGALGVGGDQNHDGILNPGPNPPAETWATPGTAGNDDSVQTFEDYDSILDTDGCHDSPGDDTDGDKFSDEHEAAMGTNAVRACAATETADDESPDPQPEDFNDDGSITGFDLSQIAGVIGQNVPPAPARHDLTVDGVITGAELSLIAGVIGRFCVPPGPLG